MLKFTIFSTIISLAFAAPGGFGGEHGGGFDGGHDGGFVGGHGGVHGGETDGHGGGGGGGLGGHGGLEGFGDDGDHGHYVDYHSHPKYNFDYGVKDAHTGDHKSHWEHRDGDQVKGGYTLHEADGTLRIVEYNADKHSGFNAVVKRVGHADHPSVYGHADAGHGGHGGGGQGAGHGAGSQGDGGHGHGGSSYANHNQHSHHH